MIRPMCSTTPATNDKLNCSAPSARDAPTPFRSWGTFKRNRVRQRGCDGIRYWR
ncbi:uncharacterized protein LACBIDRAFT_315491 [Laccaria bicolor S238N-H82]|uniref:Predicted protein n=1 Tax=Laccaria bicolor (strain S238N-H82 / ATCC MYA-4686) TaxID=486041 RepID=B0D2I5_LACBS|nr:uncharacterized protein LACBIDRAFT_315491 [Laccaria bicolor S238N-H82]EDR11102.1 predicted protein [Laccaria bicolor S238N-H82]|eukprot:XP_001878403.1 predicted protein [Laccaria bicolor S238N-H82]